MALKLQEMFNRPLMICFFKKGKDKLCRYSGREHINGKNFNRCLLFMTPQEGKLCTPSMRRKGEVEYQRKE